MSFPRPTTSLRSDTALLSAFASLLLVVHFLMGNGYGFHRDELQFLDDARHLHWGFVAYPPVTAFCGRIAIAIFGISPQVFRLPAAIVNAFSLVLTGLLARELGGRKPAQVLALFAGLPVALVFSSVLQYNTFDHINWTMIALLTARILRTGDQRWWIAVGAAAGFGILSKYSIAFPVLSLTVALAILPSQRHHLRNRWFWLGALTMLVVAAPNLIWLVRHHFITLEMEHFIHVRDVRNGRAEGYFTDQIKFTLFALPLAVTGLIALLRSARFRLLTALYLGPLLLIALAKGRGYYLMPGYPVLYAAGAVTLERFLEGRTRTLRVGLRALVLSAMLVDAAAVAWAYLPIGSVGSTLWNWQMKNNSDMKDEVGWPELVADVAQVRDTLPKEDLARLAILADNYGEAGAISLYGPQYGLPTPISGINSFHDRGFGPYPPETVIVVGESYASISRHFESCAVAGHLHIPYGVRNEESVDHPDILVCHHLRHTWPEIWKKNQNFG
jgi:hypothetical protein